MINYDILLNLVQELYKIILWELCTYNLYFLCSYHSWYVSDMPLHALATGGWQVAYAYTCHSVIDYVYFDKCC